MSDFLQLLSGPHWNCLGLALLHFLWQGLCIGIVLEIALVLVGRKNAALRHVLCGVALAVMPVCLVGTYGTLQNAVYRPAPPPAALSVAAHHFYYRKDRFSRSGLPCLR